MSFQRVSLLVATRKRPVRLKTFLDSYYATTSGGNDSEIVFRVDYDDPESIQMLAEHDFLTVVGPRRKGYRSMPDFYNEMARLATGDILMGANDDTIIETPGWPQLIIEAANRYPDGIFNFGVDTVMHDENFPFFCVSRIMVDRLGFINDDRVLFSDTFLLDLAKHFNRAIRLPTVMFRHDWAGLNPDETHLEANRHAWDMVFADTTGAWTEEYRKLHDGVVAEAVARLDPDGEVIAGIWNQGYIKFQLSIKCFPIRLAIAVDEISRARYFITVLAEQPLVDFHLSLISDLPVFIKLGYILGL